MKSKWIDERLSAKKNMKDNLPMIYLVIFYFFSGVLFFIISVITKNYIGVCGVIGYIFLTLALVMLVAYFLKSCILSKKMVMSKLRKKNLTQKDLDLLDEELYQYKYKSINFKYDRMILTYNYLVKDSLLYSKVDVFKITYLHKIIYWESGFHISSDKGFPPDKNNGLIEFYDAYEEKIFAFNELREDCEKIIEYFKENRKDISVEIVENGGKNAY